MMKLFLAFFVIFSACTSLQAQFSDDFSDGNFTENPEWTGAPENFSVVNDELRLTAPAITSTAFLSTPSAVINNASWTFQFRMDSETSNANFARVYLIADGPNLSDQPNGYYVEIGNTQDEVSLYAKIPGEDKIKIIDGKDFRVRTPTIRITIKVTRAFGHWELFTDSANVGTFIKEGEVENDKITTSSWFGVYCQFSSTRSDDYYFDNFEVEGEGFIDTHPPLLQSTEVLSSSALKLKFSEPLQEAEALIKENFFAGDFLGYPLYVSLESENEIRLTFANDFVNGVSYPLTISGLKDLANNTMEDTTVSFHYFSPSPVSENDVIITEIFADPDPPVGLPSAEFVELLNRSSNPVQLSDWTLSDPTRDGQLPEHILLPDEYIIVTTADQSAAFGAFGEVLGVQNFPTLNNSGDELTLRNETGILIDKVSYHESWYQDEDKMEGGWSLEIIDPENTCSEDKNWTASASLIGGTPGGKNSVYESRPDLTAPQLVTCTPLSDSSILIQYDEKLNAILPDKDSFSFSPALEVTEVAFFDESKTNFVLTVDNILPSTLYKVTNLSIHDCAGNTIPSDQASTEWALPETALPGDVVINEILFNPFPNGVDFVELYNPTEKYLSILGWTLSNIDDDQPTGTKIISTNPRLLKPGEYVALTSMTSTLAASFINAPKAQFLEMSLPSFPDTEGSVLIMDSSGIWIDHLYYKETMHSVFLKSDEGVSLERLSAEVSSDVTDNWKSAASTAGFGTPGYRNSNTFPENTVDQEVIIDPVAFNPKGYPDYTTIRYSFTQSDYVGNVMIANAQGSVIKTLANNALLGASGFFRWDGDTDGGERARMGYYFAYFETFDPSGHVRRFRKRIVVATTY